MTLALISLFALLAFLHVLAGLWSRRTYEFPFFAGCVMLGWVVPEMLSEWNAQQYIPERAFQVYLVMACLCSAAIGLPAIFQYGRSRPRKPLPAAAHYDFGTLRVCTVRPPRQPLPPRLVVGRRSRWPRPGPVQRGRAHAGPAEALSDEFPLRLTTGRALDSYNTGVQSGSMDSPIRYGDTIDLSPADAARLGVGDGDPVRVTSARGSVEMPARIDRGLPEGLTFTTFHFPELVDVNLLTNDAWDPRSGTSEFKAAAIRIDPVAEAERPIAR